MADFDGNGRADLFLHNEDPASAERWRSRFVFMNEDGTHRTVDYPVAPGFASPPWILRGIADYNGDGRADLMIHNEDPSLPDQGSAFLYLLNADGSQRVVGYPTTPGFAHPLWQVVTPAR